MKRVFLSVPEHLYKAGSRNDGLPSRSSHHAASPLSSMLPPSRSSDQLRGELAEQQRSVTRLGDWVPKRRENKAAQGHYELMTGDSSPISSSSWIIGGFFGFCSSLKNRIIASVPILEWLPNYDVKNYLFTDCVAGTTLALICVVQTLAHASIASTEVIQGPYCAFMPPLVYACLGTSRHASISSGAIVAILLADQLAFFPDIEDRTQLASMLAFLSGCMLMLMGLCKAAFAVRFLSQSLISGFVTGGSILIMQGQLRNLCGLRMRHVVGFFPTACEMWKRFHTTNMVGLFLGVSQILGLYYMMPMKRYAVKRLKGKGPKPWWLGPMKILAEMKELVMVFIGVVFAIASRDANGEAILPIVGQIPQGLPSFQVPWDTKAVERLVERSPHRQHQFVLGGAMLALTSFLSTYATAKKQALNHNYRIDASQEVFALGMAGITGSFFQSFTPSGSLSRTSLSAEMGVKTQLNGVMTTLVIGTVLRFLTPCLYYLPNATLGAIILKSAWNLVDLGYAKELWQAWKPHSAGGQKRDLVVWCIAFVMTVWQGALYGIACAVIVSIALIVYDAATPRVVTLGMVASLGNIWRDVEVWEGEVYPGMLVVEFRGPLFFASAEWFEDELEKKRQECSAEKAVKVIVLYFGSVHDLDPTALSMLKEILTVWKAKDISIIIAEAKSRVRLLLEKHFAGGQAPLLPQPAFIISLDDAVALGMRALEHRGLRLPSVSATPGRSKPPKYGQSRFARAEPHVI